MINIKIIATGSAGNCYIIEDGHAKILLDPGIPAKKIQVACNFTLSTFDLCIVSHEHKDHCLAAKDVARLGVKMAMSHGTRDAIGGANMDVLLLAQLCEIEYLGWRVLPFEVEHDAVQPMGFLIQTPSNERILYASDMGCLLDDFAGVTHWLIECNYCDSILDANIGLDPMTKNRIRRSHFGLENLKEFFGRQDLKSTKSIHLIHLSDANSDQNLIQKEIEGVTGKPVYFL